jgi:hypothetical protein
MPNSYTNYTQFFNNIFFHFRVILKSILSAINCIRLMNSNGNIGPPSSSPRKSRGMNRGKAPNPQLYPEEIFLFYRNVFHYIFNPFIVHFTGNTAGHVPYCKNNYIKTSFGRSYRGFWSRVFEVSFNI